VRDVPLCCSVLSREGERIEEQNSRCGRCLALFRPFVFVYGALLFILSLFLFVSIAMTQIDIVAHTNLCGASCGYLVNMPYLDNPLDYVLRKMAGWQVRERAC
jgi:hypothetical protein